MKYVFSLYLFGLFMTATSAKANIINIYHINHLDNAKMVKRIFVDKYGLPEKMISLFLLESNDQEDCPIKVDKRLMNLCVTKKGKLKLLPSNIDFLKESLSIFRISTVSTKQEISNDA